MLAPIHKLSVEMLPKYPCWLFLPECQAWEWFESLDATVDYTLTVFSHWSPGGRPAKPGCPNDTDGDGDCHLCHRHGRCFNPTTQ